MLRFSYIPIFISLLSLGPYYLGARVNTTGLANLVARDRARIQSLFVGGKATSPLKSDIVGSVTTTNGLVDYVVNVQIGSPPTTYSLLIDTGSANTWVGAGKPYVQTQTSVQTPFRVSVTYNTEESMSGTEFSDQVSFGAGLQVFGQSIGAATESEGFDGLDGVLGLGPQALSVGTLSGSASATSIATVTDSLFQQAVIQANTVAISFEPAVSGFVTNGELTFGGTDSSKFVGSINFVPITTTSPSSKFWGFNQQIRYGTGSSTSTSTNILSSTAGVIDAGSTLSFVATDAFERYQAATNAVFDGDVGLLKITNPEFVNIKSLFYIINGVTFEFTADAQIWPRELNELIGGNGDNTFLILSDIGVNSGSGMDFINGMTWMERFYVVLDTTNKRVGIANTQFTRATTNANP